MSDAWKRCSSCKKDIAFERTYYLCSVSTCTRKRTGMFFCSVECWEIHLPLMRHREAWAVEETAPTRAAWAASGGGDKAATPRSSSPNKVSQPVSKPSGPSVLRRTSSGATSAAPTRRVVEAKPKPAPAPKKTGPLEVLVVASRLKNYVREVHGFNTSDGVLDPLSAEIRRLIDKAVEKAAEDGRKTVLDRDFAFLRSRLKF